MRKAQGVRGRRAAARDNHDAVEDRRADEDRAPVNDGQPRCRIPGCGAVMQGGNCPACAYRAKLFAPLFKLVNPICECGAPKRPPKVPGSLRMPKHCVRCSKLHALMKKRGLA